MMIAVTCGGVLLGGRIRVASTFGARLLGLMFHKSLPEGSGLLLAPCSSIHMCFMRMALDIVYLDKERRVLGVQKGLKPWRLGRAAKGTAMVLELPAGTLERCALSPGDTLDFTPAAETDSRKKRG
jgi:uncharacterized membrane protein (UPF0127 family)